MFIPKDVHRHFVGMLLFRPGVRTADVWPPLAGITRRRFGMRPSDTSWQKSDRQDSSQIDETVEDPVTCIPHRELAKGERQC